MAETKPARRYTDQEVYNGLAALLVAGSSLRASKMCGIPSRTLRAWRTEHHEIFAGLKAKHGAKLEETFADDLREFVSTEMSIKRDMLDKLETSVATMDPRDVARNLKDLTLTTAVDLDKLYLLTDRPTVLVEHRSTTELVETLGGHVDGTAEEID